MDFGNMLCVVTRVPHRCEWCGEQILVGSKVGNYRGQFQGDWQNWYIHPECESVYNDMNSRGDLEDGFMPYENERPKEARVI